MPQELRYIVRNESILAKNMTKLEIISNEMIGSKEFLKVSVNKEIYYIPRSKVKNGKKNDFLFTYTRKDLIKVNGVIHGDLLNE